MHPATVRLARSGGLKGAAALTAKVLVVVGRQRHVSIARRSGEARDGIEYSPGVAWLTANSIRQKTKESTPCTVPFDPESLPRMRVQDRVWHVGGLVRQHLPQRPAR